MPVYRYTLGKPFMTLVVKRNGVVHTGNFATYGEAVAHVASLSDLNSPPSDRSPSDNRYMLITELDNMLDTNDKRPPKVHLEVHGVLAAIEQLLKQGS